ncbi:hypothetical protein CHUAL_008821 [Chamberlinius hualienensis]
MESVNDYTWLESADNFSIEAYLDEHLGPKHLPMDIVLPITIVYVIIFITGVLGNVSVCLVIVKKSSMQTATNYYLFSLAVSDVLQLIFGLPNDLRLFWQQYPWALGEAMCRTRALISETTNYASVLTIVAFTVERYVAICHPLLSQTTSSLPRVIKVIAANWIIAGVVATPYAVLTSVHYIDYPQGSKRYIPESAFCMMPTNPKDNPHFRTLLVFSSMTFFIVPMALICILYIKIGLKLRKSKLGPSERTGMQEGKVSSRKPIIRMLVAVVIAFFICWAPFHAQRLLFVYADTTPWSKTLRIVNEILFYAGCLYYFNATVNPILYNIMSVKYRESFKEVLFKSFPHLTCWNKNINNAKVDIIDGTPAISRLKISYRRRSLSCSRETSEVNAVTGDKGESVPPETNDQRRVQERYTTSLNLPSPRQSRNFKSENHYKKCLYHIEKSDNSCNHVTETLV